MSSKSQISCMSYKAQNRCKTNLPSDRCAKVKIQEKIHLPLYCIEIEILENGIELTYIITAICEPFV
jgi:hypothetical protein